MKQIDINHKQSSKAISQNQKERQSTLKIASIALLSLILTACSTNKAHFEIDYREINCSGWFFMTGSIKDTVETKKQIVAHNTKYINDCRNDQQ